jgi:hypothetical protein
MPHTTCAVEHMGVGHQLAAHALELGFALYLMWTSHVCNERGAKLL